VVWDWFHFVRRPLLGVLYQPRMINDYEAFGGMRTDRGRRGIQRKPVPVPLCPSQILHGLSWYRTRAVVVRSYTCNRPRRPVGFRAVEASTFSRQSAHRWRWECQPYAPASLYPQEDSWYSFLSLSWLQGHSAAWRIRSIEIFNDHIGNQTRNLWACSIVQVANLSLKTVYLFQRSNKVFILWNPMIYYREN
jgi:hypothetical protein